jgi:lipopolysaccharide transport system ATP-binding protein
MLYDERGVITDTVIKVENLGKKYFIRHQGDEDQSLNKMFRKKVRREEFWALKDINFEVQRGDRLGIIGRNGAGKSTLLKILSQITEPTLGKATIKGRVASLLEVGTGFHGDLTGRENIFLNGTILGMGRSEIRKKFNDIVDFAEVRQFLDTPVKRYSSGMYLRLAFAIAAHIEPNILIVDEVLAVGDVAFQKKSIGKMQEISSSEGRTVIFVSHNMNAIQQLCDKCILLEKGSLVEYSTDVGQVIKHYMSSAISKQLNSEWVNSGQEYDNSIFFPEKFYIGDASGNVLEMPIDHYLEAYVWIEFTMKILDPAFEIGFTMYNDDGIRVLWSYQIDSSEDRWPVLKLGKNRLRARLPEEIFNEGSYTIEMIASLHIREWILEPFTNNPSIKMEIQSGISESPYWRTKREAVIAPVLKWENIDN